MAAESYTVKPHPIPGVLEIVPPRFGDHRGFFSETWNRRDFEAIGIRADFVQDNHSYSAEPYTIRGLHFQRPPHAQGKLIRVIRGRIFDVVVDMRRGSPTYGRSLAVELSAEAWNQLWVPEGLAHGFCTLEPDTEVLYKVTAHYAPDHESGIRWNDPDLAIPWPLPAGATCHISDKDRSLPLWREVDSPFIYSERPHRS